MNKTAHTPESIAALDAAATQGKLSVFRSTIDSERFYLGTDAVALARSEIGATRYADFELYAALVNLYRSGRLAILPQGIADPSVVPEAIEALREANSFLLAFANVIKELGADNPRSVYGPAIGDFDRRVTAILAKLEGGEA
jgi:hypothetical protein